MSEFCRAEKCETYAGALLGGGDISHFGLGLGSKQRRNTFDTRAKTMHIIILPMKYKYLRPPPESYPVVPL